MSGTEAVISEPNVMRPLDVHQMDVIQTSPFWQSLAIFLLIPLVRQNYCLMQSL
jgi:hypothetical protein